MVVWNWELSTAISWAKRIVQRGGALALSGGAFEGASRLCDSAAFRKREEFSGDYPGFFRKWIEQLMVVWNWELSTAVSWAKRIVQRGGALEGPVGRRL